MKKTLALLLILAVSLTAVGCKSKPVDDEETYLEKEQIEQAADAGEQQQTEPEQSDEQLPEQNEEQPDNTQQAEPTDSETTEESSVTQEQTEQTEQTETEQTETEKGPTCTATLDDDFVDNEINVTLTKVESRKQKEYTAEDFPELDIENVYYLFNYYPDTDGYAILNIVLQNHDKQKVLEGIRILEGYDIVYRAEPVLIGTIIHSDSKNEITLKQMESIISEISLTSRYTSTDAMSEYNANLSTLACCAKKYTTAGINKTTAIVKV